MVRVVELEPTLLSELDFESIAFTKGRNASKSSGKLGAAADK